LYYYSSNHTQLILAGSIGVGALLSRGVKFFKYGHKVAGNSLHQAGKQVATNVMKTTFKEAAKEVIKSTATTIGKAVAFQVLRQGIETLVQKYLRGFCNQVGTAVIGLFNNIFIYFSGLPKTLEDLYKSCGKAEAKQFVKQTMQKILSGGQGFVKNVETLFNSVLGSVSTGISNALAKRKMAQAKELEAASIALDILNSVNKIYEQFKFIFQIENLLKGHVGDFNTELKKCCESKKGSSTKSSEEKKISDEEVENFKVEVENELKSTLGKEAGRMIEAWTAKMLNKAAVCVVQIVAKEAKKVYNKKKENNEIKRLRKLQTKERQRKLNESNGTGSADQENQGPSEAHVEECMKIMKKTNSAKVFAEIVKEGVPLDRFCVQALEEVLPKVLEGVSNLKISVETTDGEFSHQTPTAHGDSANVINLHLDRENNHFISGEETKSGNHDCMLVAAAEQLKQMYPGQNIPDAETLRELIANKIEQSPEIRASIERGWHQYTLNQKMFGGVPRGCGEHGYGGFYKDARKRSERGIADADHQPAFSMFQNAKDPGVRSLTKGELPTLTIPTDRHSETLNYKGRANSFKSTSAAGAFNFHQRDLMQKGQYMDAIWHAVNVNWMPWMKDLPPAEKTQYKAGLDKYCEDWTKLKMKDGSSRTVISSAEGSELKRRISMKLFREAASQQQASNHG